jgi:GT2 family glycosyltransferase
MPEIGIVILNYLTYSSTVDLVISLQNQKNISLFIVIVDNNSPNDSYAILKSKFCSYPNIKIIQTKENKGYAIGNNIGLNFLLSVDIKYAAIINPDVIITDQFLLLKLFTFCEKETSIGIASPVMRINGESSYALSSWKFPTLLNDLFLFSRILGFMKMKFFNNSTPKDILEVDCLAGSFLFCHFPILHSVGFFDENTFLFNEETILCFKIKKLNYKNFLLTNIFYDHEHSKSINLSMRVIEKYLYLYESKLYYWRYYKRNYLSSFIVLSFGIMVSYLETFIIHTITMVSNIINRVFNKLLK